MTTLVSPLPIQRFYDAANLPLVGGKLYTYLAGTTTPAATYTDATGVTPNANPVVMNARGEASVWLDPTLSYKFVLKTAADVTIWTADNLVGAQAAGLNVSLAAASGSSLVGYIGVVTGSVARTVQSKLRDVVSITDFGASTASTAAQNKTAIQLALNSGATSVYVPSGTFNCDEGLVMPNVFGFVLYGDGPSSILKMSGAVASALIGWSTAAMVYNEQTIRNVTITGTTGAGHCIDTSGGGGLTLQGVYIADIPVGKSGVYMNGCAATQTHDIRVLGLQIYSNTAGHSGVRLGPLCADSSVSEFIMNGNVLTDYCLYFDAGVVACDITDSHPYNAKINVMKIAGDTRACSFNGVTFDHAVQDIISATTLTNSTFTGCYIEAIPTGYSGVKLLTTCQGITFSACHWQCSAAALSAVSGDASTNTIQVMGGTITVSTDYVTPFNFAGTNCWARGIGGYSPLGLEYNYVGVSQVAQTAATTVYLGMNGAQATFSATAYLVPYNSVFVSVYIAADVTPAVAQTYTYQAYVNGSPVGTALTVNNLGFGGTITINLSVAQYDQVAVRCVVSAGASTPISRYLMKFTA